MKRIRFVVTGRVQGVGFRWFVKAEARPLGLTGWVRNREDGAVEGEVEGRDDAVEALGINAADAAPDYWHHAHNRLSVGEAPRSYTRSRHQIWLQRRKIAP